MTVKELSRQETRIAQLSMGGLSDQQVANQLGISLDTVRTYWKRIRQKMGGFTRAEIFVELARASVMEGLEEAQRQLRSETARRIDAERKLAECEARFKALGDSSQS